MGVQNAFRVCSRAGGVDQESRIVGGGIGVSGDRPAFDGGYERCLGDDGENGREGAVRQAVVEDDGGGLTVVQHEREFALGEVRRYGNRDEAARDGSEKRERIGGAIAQADENAVAALQLVFGVKSIGSPKHRVLQGSV